MRTLSLEKLRDPDVSLDSARTSAVSGEQGLDRIALWLDSVLDDDFLLLRDVELPGGQASVDMLLLGPSGIWTLYVESEPGQYKTEHGGFYAWETRAGGYVKISPNPLLILKSNLNQLRGWLSRERLPIECAHSAILFTDKAAVVESDDADVQLVAPDLVEAFPVQIAKEPALLVQAAVERAAFAVARGKLPPAPPIFTAEEEPEPRLRLPVQFSRRQWILLGVLAFLDVAVLGGLGAVVFFLAR